MKKILETAVIICLIFISEGCDSIATGTVSPSPTPTPVPMPACPDIYQPESENPFRFQLLFGEEPVGCGHPCILHAVYIDQVPYPRTYESSAFNFQKAQTGESYSLVMPNAFINRIQLEPMQTYTLIMQVVPNWPTSYGLMITQDSELVFLGIADWKHDASIVLDCLSPVTVEQSRILPPCQQAVNPCIGQFTKTEMRFSLGSETSTLQQHQTATLGTYQINLDIARILDHSFCPDAGAINISYTITNHSAGNHDSSTREPEAVVSPQPVQIPDANLERYIHNLLQPESAQLTQNEMLKLACLFRLDAFTPATSESYTMNPISHLTGLEYAANLQSIHLSSAEIADLSPVSDLFQLRKLRIDHNSITDLTPLQDLASLTKLWVGNNDINNLTALSGLTGLTVLSLDDNHITNLAPLSSLTYLTDLSLYKNEITDISPLSSLIDLRRLRLDLNAISDISSLSNLTGLTGLSINDNSVADIHPLQSLVNLTTLSLVQNNVSDISALTTLANLVVVYLGSNQIESVQSLEHLGSIRLLDLQDNNITDISPLLQNNELGEGVRIDLRGNPLNAESVNQLIPELESRGVMIAW